MNRIPPSLQPAMFSLRQLVQLRNAPNRWAYALSASFCIAAPVVVGWIAGDVAAGVIASFGAFTALYGADRPYRNSAIKFGDDCREPRVCCGGGRLVEAVRYFWNRRSRADCNGSDLLLQ